MMRNRTTIVLAALLAVATGAGLYFWSDARRARRGGSVGSQEQTDDAGKQAARLEQLEQENASLRAQLAERGAAPAPTASTPAGEGEARRLEVTRELTKVEARLSAANAALSEMKARAQELQASLDQAAGENKRLAAANAELNNDLESTRNLLHATEIELKGKAERLPELEAAAKRARDDRDASAQKLAQVNAALAEMADVNRRREAAVTALQRRFRDLTDQLRAASVRLEQQRDNPAAAMPDLSRIQTVVPSAEDDLRQLNSLNAQAQRVAQKLGVK